MSTHNQRRGGRGGRGGSPAGTQATKSSQVFPRKDSAVVFQYDKESGQWLPRPSTTHRVSLDQENVWKIVSYNVLFDMHQPELIYTEHRVPVLMDVLQKTGAHMIALQEVTPPFLQTLLQQQWVKDSYYVSDIDGSTLQPYGQILLSKFPVDFIELFRFSAWKLALIAHYTFVKNGTEISLTVPVVHLTSDLSSDAAQKRAKQLQQLFTVTEKYENTVLMGDFNFGDGEESDSIDWGYFVDVWQETRGPKDPGFSFDPPVNTMAKVTSKTGVSRRLDRILVKSLARYLTPVSTCLIGTEPFLVTVPVQHQQQQQEQQQQQHQEPQQQQQVVVYPSDHYGVLCELAVSV